MTDEVIENLRWETAMLALNVEEERIRPSTIHRPALSVDGNQWCALYGENLQDGVAGFGDSPADAFLAFDEAWRTPCRRARKETP